MEILGGVLGLLYDGYGSVVTWLDKPVSNWSILFVVILLVLVVKGFETKLEEIRRAVFRLD